MSTPRTLLDMVAIIGVEASLQLVAHFGGSTLEIPADPFGRGKNAFANLECALGHDAAVKLCKAYAYERVYVPRRAAELRAQRNQKIVREFNAGVSVPELTKRHHLSDRWVWRILKSTSLEAQQSQLPLFE